MRRWARAVGSGAVVWGRRPAEGRRAGVLRGLQVQQPTVVRACLLAGWINRTGTADWRGVQLLKGHKSFDTFCGLPSASTYCTVRALA